MIELLGLWKKERRNKEIKKGAVRKSPTVKVTAIKHNLIKKKIVKQCLRVFFFTYDDWSWGVIKWNDWSLSLLSSSNVIQINRQATQIKKEIFLRYMIDLSIFETRWLISLLLIKLKCNPNKSAGKYKTVSPSDLEKVIASSKWVCEPEPLYNKQTEPTSLE